MAKRQQSDIENIAITLVGKDEAETVLFESFAIVVSAFRNLLNEIDKDRSLQWRVKGPTTNSPLFMELEAPVKNKNDHRKVDDCLRFIRELPPEASPNAATQVKTIRNIVSNDSVARINFDSRGRERVTVWPKNSDKSSKSPPSVTHHSEYSCHIQLIGYLEIASIENRERAFFIRDRIKGTTVRCEGNDEHWTKALDAMKRHISPRIAVYGKAQYRDDKPYKMKVESFEVLPTLEDHPGLYAVQGIDITDGMDSVAYVRSLRDGD
jgi:hypothetical protein